MQILKSKRVSKKLSVFLGTAAILIINNFYPVLDADTTSALWKLALGYFGGQGLADFAKEAKG